MPTGHQLSKTSKIAFAFVALVLMAIGIYVSSDRFTKSEPAAPADDSITTVATEPTAFVPPPPTDTVRIGTVTFDTPGLKQDTLYLNYEEPGKPALVSELVIDEHSYCNLGSGGLPCMAMSVTYGTAFGGKRALIDGNVSGDKLVVRRLRVLNDGEDVRGTTPGTIYIPWMQARTMILSCAVQSLMQTHEGQVFITGKDGSKTVAIEPVIDEVFKVASESTAQCGNVQLGTE